MRQYFFDLTCSGKMTYCHHVLRKQAVALMILVTQKQHPEIICMGPQYSHLCPHGHCKRTSINQGISQLQSLKQQSEITGI